MNSPFIIYRYPMIFIVYARWSILGCLQAWNVLRETTTMLCESAVTRILSAAIVQIEAALSTDEYLPLDFECPSTASQVPGKHSAQDLLDSVALLAPSSSWGPGAPQRSSWLLTPSPDTQGTNGKFVVVESWRLEISHLEFRKSGGLNLSSQVSMRIYLSGKLALYGFVTPELDGSEFGKPSITILVNHIQQYPILNHTVPKFTISRQNMVLILNYPAEALPAHENDENESFVTAWSVFFHWKPLRKKGPSTLWITTLPWLQPEKGQPQLFLKFSSTCQRWFPSGFYLRTPTATGKNACISIFEDCVPGPFSRVNFQGWLLWGPSRIHLRNPCGSWLSPSSSGFWCDKLPWLWLLCCFVAREGHIFWPRQDSKVLHLLLVAFSIPLHLFLQRLEST